MKSEMNLYALLNMIKDILDEEEFPEVCRVIDEESENKDLPIGEAPRIASRIMECDKPKQFPQELIDFVKGLYEIGIAAGDAGAMNDLGAQYYDGHRGFEQSFSKAAALHYIYTNADGIATTKAEKYVNENYYDKVSDYDGTAGTVWFGQGNDGMLPSKDGAAALPLGKYTMTEKRCKANKDYQMNPAQEVEITKDALYISIRWNTPI